MPRFSPEARAAASRMRAIRSSKNIENFGKPEVFALRVSSTEFRWELRQYGGVVLRQGDEIFKTAEQARRAGALALAAASSLDIALPQVLKRNHATMESI